MSAFYCEDNLRMLVTVTKKYLDDKYSITIEDDKALRKLVHDTMTEVEEECSTKPHIPLEKKNVIVLNAVKEVYIRKNKNNKPNIQNLSRDREIFGNRPIQSSVILPEMEPYQKKSTNKLPKDFTRIMEDRDGEMYGHPIQHDITKLGPVTKEIPEDNDIFMKKLKELEDQRLALEKDFQNNNPLNTNNTAITNNVVTSPAAAEMTFLKNGQDDPILKTLESMIKSAEKSARAAESIANEVRTLCEEIRKIKNI